MKFMCRFFEQSTQISVSPETAQHSCRNLRGSRRATNGRHLQCSQGCYSENAQESMFRPLRLYSQS